jgi:hypothetical protein
MTLETDGRSPDFLVIGAPKAGTSALHAALAQHDQLFLSAGKEPKYYMCGDSPPPAYKGPGDAHSNQEWIWQRPRYRALFACAWRVLPLPSLVLPPVPGRRAVQQHRRLGEREHRLPVRQRRLTPRDGSARYYGAAR